jgi:serine/threonine-protein kinase
MNARSSLLLIGKLALLVGALGVTYGITAYAGLQLSIKSREVATPDLRGLAPAAATEALAAVGLNARIDPLRRIHPAIEPGRIAEQDPRPGSPTRLRRDVKLWLSSGPNTGELPSLVGESQNLATEHLAEELFTLREIAEIRSNRYPTDTVVAQDPPPYGSGEIVSILVNVGERGRSYVMPNLIGVDGNDAANILRGRGFRVTVVGDHPYPGIPSGIVIRQAPSSGFQVSQGESISLEVSQ